MHSRGYNSLTVSFYIVVRNEERALPRCLDSVATLVDEILVVDTGSSDNTPNVAARYGAKVTPFDFNRVDFAAARNHALEISKGRWILTLDADEVLHPASVPTIRQLVSGDAEAGYYFERWNHGPGAEKPTRDYVVRLFPNRPSHRYKGRVHETIDASILAAGGRLIPTAVRIDHDFASTPEQRQRRNLWYIDILEEELAQDPNDASRLNFLAAEYHQLGRFEEAAAITERLIHLCPCDAEARLRAGIYHLIYQTDHQRARADFLEVLRLRPGHANALSFLEFLDGA